MDDFNLVTPEDWANDFKKVLPKLTKLYLDLNSLSNMKSNIDHRAEIQKNIDDYMSNMKQFVVKLKGDIKLHKKDFVHIGYEGFGDWWDLDGKDLYSSQKWPTAIEYYQKGESWWHYALRYFGLIKG
jgi:t-SNARE complex subunit (syntaxin)